MIWLLIPVENVKRVFFNGEVDRTTGLVRVSLHVSKGTSLALKRPNSYLKSQLKSRDTGHQHVPVPYHTAILNLYHHDHPSL